MKQEFKSKSERETRNLAKLFAQEILRTKPAKKAVVIAFVGELGAGKTTFIRSLVRGLGVRWRITSPTFVIMRRYKIPHQVVQIGHARGRSSSDGRRSPISTTWHVDAYRIKSPKELKMLNLKEILVNPRNVVLIEWALKAKSVLPKGTIWIELKHGQKPNERHLTFNRR